MTSFNIYELFINFDFCNSIDDNKDIYLMYKNNIIKNNNKVYEYISNILVNQKNNLVSSNITFDSGFDLFNLDDDSVAAGSKYLIDYKIQTCMKIYDISFNTNCKENYLDIHLSDISGNAIYDNYSNLNKIINIYNTNKSSNTLDVNIKSIFNAYVGYYLYLRSSTGLNTPLSLANGVGVIDSGYRGNIKACFNCNNNYEIKRSNRYTQICPPNLSYPMIVTEVDDISNLGLTNRGDGGFGSTGA